MTRFSAISGKELVSILRSLGFDVLRIKGSHHFLQHPDETECFFVGETSISIFTKPEEIKQGMESEG